MWISNETPEEALARAEAEVQRKLEKEGHSPKAAKKIVDDMALERDKLHRENQKTRSFLMNGNRDIPRTPAPLPQYRPLYSGGKTNYATSGEEAIWQMQNIVYPSTGARSTPLPPLIPWQPSKTSSPPKDREAGKRAMQQVKSLWSQRDVAHIDKLTVEVDRRQAKGLDMSNYETETVLFAGDVGGTYYFHKGCPSCANDKRLGREIYALVEAYPDTFRNWVDTQKEDHLNRRPASD
jgi:hypothetical protein